MIRTLKAFSAASALALTLASPALAQTQDFAPQGWTAKSLPEIAAGIASGDTSAEAVVEAYLNRIEAIDRQGPTLRSVISINPDALEEARAVDAAIAAGAAVGPLAGVPILLKDNIESRELPTTAGALALAENDKGRDSPLVAGLREAGAIILGKTNLSQWANYRSEDSISGWSALGGQVKNPHMLDRSPCGSSSGSGAAMAASLAAGTVGTETNGSIICPSNVNGIVGFKPTVGLVSQQYIVPISSSQDTAGPMTKTVTGAALMLTAMATGEGAVDYVTALDAEALDGAKIGVLRFTQGSNKDIQALFNTALKDLEAAGAELVEIPSFENTLQAAPSDAPNLLAVEFKHTLNAYLAEAADAVPVKTLEDLIAFNEAHADIELALFDQSLFEQAQKAVDVDDLDFRAARARIQKRVREDGIDRLLAEHEVDILVSPSGVVASQIDTINGDVWPAWAGAGSMAAVAGYPHVSVPMGTVQGLPVGFSFIGAKDTDAAVLSFGYAYEQATNHRVDPQYLPNAEARPEIAAAIEGRG